MCNSLRLGSNLRSPASYFTDLKKEHKCLKKSTVCILHFTPACVLLLVCSLHFTLSLHFTPGPQSAVCSPQSAFYTDRFSSSAFFVSPVQIKYRMFCKFRIFSIFHTFRILEYSVYSAILFRHSVSPPFHRIGSPSFLVISQRVHT